MTTVFQTHRALLAAPKAAAGMHCFGGYAGAVTPAGVAVAVGAAAAGDVPAAGSGNILPISWLTHLRSRNRVATVVTPAA